MKRSAHLLLVSQAFGLSGPGLPRLAEPVTLFQKLTRGILERLAGIWAEGPEPPARLGEMVVAFANDRPHATRAEWVEYAQGLARESYRSGYTRGVERAERQFWSSMPSVLPEDVADALDPDWRWSPDITLMGNPDEVVRKGEEHG